MTEDPRAIWQNQTTEGVTLSVPEIQHRAKRLDRQMNQGIRIMWGAFALHVAVDAFGRAPAIQEFSAWWGLLDLVTLMLFLLYWPYQYARRSDWPPSVVPSASSLPGLDYYRRQLITRRDLVSEEYWGAGPRGGLGMILMVAILFAAHAAKYPSLMMVLAVPIAITTIVIYVRQRRELPAIDRELEELRTFMRENRA